MIEAALLVALAVGAACWALLDRATRRVESLRRELEGLSNDRVLARLRDLPQ